MKEAYLYERLGDGVVRCQLCSHFCTINPGKRGICQVRENQGGTLASLVYRKAATVHLDPIEKKPLFHFYPGSLSLSMATVGCNFRCSQCQNADISQVAVCGEIFGEDVSPHQLVEQAKETGAVSISYTYTEPTVFFEYAYDTAFLAHQAGIRNVFVSNGFMSPQAIEMIDFYLDGINIDLKAFSNETYKKIFGGKLQPVLDSIVDFWTRGVWIEVTTLVIPGINDSDKELADIADFLQDLNPDIPWHVTAFFPTHEMTDRPATTSRALAKAREIGLKAGLNYVYTGNVPGSGGEDTACPACGKAVIKRTGYRILEKNLNDDTCAFCSNPIAGRFA